MEEWFVVGAFFTFGAFAAITLIAVVLGIALYFLGGWREP